MEFICTTCSKPMGSEFRSLCSCGGFIDVKYELPECRLADSSNPYVRFSSILPVRSLELLPSKKDFSPTIRATSLGQLLGMPSLYLKNESVHPTGTTKDHMAAISLAFLWENGIRNFATSSTGNSSTAYAFAIRSFPGMSLSLFTAEKFVNRVQHADHSQVKHFGMRNASFVEASEYSGTYAKEQGLCYERGFFNLARREGLKVAFLEACDQVPEPIDWYVQAVSSAMGVYGSYKGATELMAMGHINRRPRLLCAQQECCSPMVRAFHDGCDAIQPHHIVRHPDGIAEAILRGDPTKVYPIIRQIVVESRGSFVSVSETEIREARKMVEELEGISPCFSASTAVAGLIKQVRLGTFPKNETVLINLTGRDRSRTEPGPNFRWLRRTASGWVEEQEGTDKQGITSSVIAKGRAA